jgi:hypothetical protein
MALREITPILCVYICKLLQYIFLIKDSETKLYYNLMYKNHIAAKTLCI